MPGPWRSPKRALVERFVAGAIDLEVFRAALDRHAKSDWRALARPSLQALGLHRRCGFFAAESLLDSADAIARWGGGVEAIARLAEHVSGA